MEHIQSPYHAVEVTSEQLAVSHYGPKKKKGVTLLTLGTAGEPKPNTKLFSPRYLAVNSEKSVFAVDQSQSKTTVIDFGGEGQQRVFPVSPNMDEPWC